MRHSLRSVFGLCALGLWLATPARAEGPITFGVKGGLSLACISPREIGSLAKFDWKLGPAGGGFATWSLSDRHALQIEVLYVSKGFSFGESEATDEAGAVLGKFETLRVADYLEVPVVVRASWPTDGPVRPAILAGGAFAIKLNEEQKTTGSIESAESTDGFSDQDVSVTVGAEVRIRTGPGWSLIEARYTQGLIDVANDFFDREIKNRAFTLMAGFAF